MALSGDKERGHMRRKIAEKGARARGCGAIYYLMSQFACLVCARSRICSDSS